MSSLCCCMCRRERSGPYTHYASLKNPESQRSTGGRYEPPVVRKASSNDGIPSMRDFSLLRTLGRGGFSKVLQVQHKTTGKVYALKVVSKTVLKTDKEEERLLAESQILRRVDHPFCVILQSSFQTPRHLCYVFDFVPGGMLLHQLRQSRTFNEARARFYLGEILLALEYLHSLGIIYRDLKLENCLLSAEGHIKLTDFGTAKELGEEGVTRTFCGTPSYIAPEVLRGEHYGQSVDWWTCGIILYEMLVGRAPFQGNNRHSLYKNVLKAPVSYPQTLSPAACDLMKQLLQRNPSTRLGGNVAHRGQTAVALKQHPFFRTAADLELGTSEETQPALACHIINTWTWSDMEKLDVEPPWKPGLDSLVDVKYFDPVVTTEPATLADLPGERGSVDKKRAVYLEDFDFSRDLAAR